MKIKIWHPDGISSVETEKVRLVLENGKITAVDTDEQMFLNVTMIELS